MCFLPGKSRSLLFAFSFPCIPVCRASHSPISTSAYSAICRTALFLRGFVLNSSSLEQHRIRDAFCRALVSLMRETNEKHFPAHPSLCSCDAEREDRHPGATLHKACLLRGSGRAAQRAGGKAGAVAGCRGAQLVLVSARCKECVSHPLRARGSLLCLTQSAGGLHTALFQPPSIQLPSTLIESPPKAKRGAV